VVSPDDLLPAPKTQPQPKSKPPSEAKPAPKPQPKAAAPGKEQAQPTSKPATPAAKPEVKQSQKQAAKEEAAAEEKPQPQAKSGAAKGPSGPEGAAGTSGAAGPAAAVGAESGGTPAVGTSAAEPASTGRASTGAASTQGAPVTLMISDGSVTIASDDVEALNDLESLLHTLSERSSDGILGRNYSMFEVRNTSAAAVAQVLQQMFREKTATSSANRGESSRYGSSRYGSSRYGSSRYGRTNTPLVITPDERLNTILVQGSRADRSMIETLITVLDTDDVPNTFAARKPKMIPIKNVRASEIETTLRSIFSSQLGSGGSGSAASAGFRPQLAVDEVTNTLILAAPAPLLDEITDLAEMLDQKAGDDPAKGLRIIPLKKSNAGSVEKALDAIMRSSSGYRRR
jgi:type II secretory pathway component GspD/PulD (secretin)